MPLLSWMYRLLRWLLGGLFIYSGATKLLAPHLFAVLIDAYGIVPDGLLMPVAVILPALEVLAGVGLLFDIHGSLVVITGLLLLFVAILGYGIWMGLDVDCGCFGPEDPEAEAFHGLRPALYRDMVMLTAVVFLYGWRRYRRVQTRKISLLMDKWLTRFNRHILNEQ
ncbi:MAG: DoxX family membrane protein [Deltaproteobacteria bacterium]|nr:DoxX family membrane protein [Deltaproteobacteria bacterium]